MEKGLPRTQGGLDDQAKSEAAAQASVLDALIEIRQHQHRLAEFKNRALEIREQIDGQVYRKVLADYDCRRAELEQAATALLAQAKTEYRSSPTSGRG